jgi:hypothetical protein
VPGFHSSWRRSHPHPETRREPNRCDLEPFKPETPKITLYLVLLRGRPTLQVVDLRLAHFRLPVRPAVDGGSTSLRAGRPWPRAVKQIGTRLHLGTPKSASVRLLTAMRHMACGDLGTPSHHDRAGVRRCPWPRGLGISELQATRAAIFRSMPRTHPIEDGRRPGGFGVRVTGRAWLAEEIRGH